MKFDFCTTNIIKNIACALFSRQRIARPVSHLPEKPESKKKIWFSLIKFTQIYLIP